MATGKPRGQSAAISRHELWQIDSRVSEKMSLLLWPRKLYLKEQTVSSQDSASSGPGRNTSPPLLTSFRGITAPPESPTTI